MINIASQKIRDVVAGLTNVDLVLLLKNEEVSSVNAHGRFSLVDQDWGVHGKETLVAFVSPGQSHPSMTASGEPVVHVHLKEDWSKVRLLRVEPFNPPVKLIDVDTRIGFYLEGGKKMAFGFYANSKQDSKELRTFLEEKRGDTIL